MKKVLWGLMIGSLFALVGCQGSSHTTRGGAGGASGRGKRRRG